MRELIETLKNYGAYAILNEIVKQGYTKHIKGSVPAQTVPVLLEHGIIEDVKATEFMRRHLHFSSEQSKQNYIENTYFLEITDKGRLVYELTKWQKESLKEERRRSNQAVANERKRIGQSLLNAVGIDLEDLTDDED